LPNFTTTGATIRAWDPKTENFTDILPNFGIYIYNPLHDFHEICSIAIPFQAALAFKIWMHLTNFDPLAVRSVGGFGAPQQISTGFASWLRYCSGGAQRRPTKLCAIFGRLLGWYTMYTSSGVLPRDGILLHPKLTLHPSLAFCYMGIVTARHSSSGRQPNIASWYKEWNY